MTLPANHRPVDSQPPSPPIVGSAHIQPTTNTVITGQAHTEDWVTLLMRKYELPEID